MAFDSRAVVRTVGKTNATFAHCADLSCTIRESVGNAVSYPSRMTTNRSEDDEEIVQGEFIAASLGPLGIDT